MKPLMFSMLFLVLSWAGATQAQPVPDACTDFFKNMGAFRYHRFESNEGKCFMSATPVDTPDYIYRSYLFTSDGGLMVWLSMDFDEYGESDGARVFTFFPRNQTPTIVDQNGYVTLKSSTAGFEINLSTTKAQIVSVTGGNFTEDPKIYPGNNGGVEFSNMKFLYLDSGYMNGESPNGVPSRKSKFVDINGKTCEVGNREVYRWDSDGDPFLKFTDDELKKWLKTRCPALTVTY